MNLAIATARERSSYASSIGWIVLLLMGVLALSPVADAQTVIFVDDDAPAAGDGTTWTTAYRFLQNALADAAAIPAPRDVEIHIGQGTYLPDHDELDLERIGDRLATFVIIDGTALFGGYAGVLAENPDLRDPVLFETSLSGDLGGNDIMPGFQNMRENSELIVELLSTNTTIVLDGLVIEGGYSAPSSALGAGVRILSGHASFGECIFRRNVAKDLDFNNQGRGGALHVLDARVTVHQCLFLDNRATHGGAVWIGLNEAIRSEFTSCHFEGNSAGMMPPGGHGSAIFVDGEAVDAVNIPVLYMHECSLKGNGPLPTPEDEPPTFLHGTVTVDGPPCWISNSSFVGNVADFGSAVLLRSDQVGSERSRLANCLIVGNISNAGFHRPESGSSAVSFGFTNAEIVNCTIFMNQSDASGGGLFVGTSGLRVANSIIWANSAAQATGGQEEQFFLQDDRLDIPVGQEHLVRFDNCIIQDWGVIFPPQDIPSQYIITVDPEFIDVVGPDLIRGTGDEDYRLSAASPGIDAGDRAFLDDSVPDVFDDDGDGDFVEPIPVDFYGQPRLRDDPLTPDTGDGCTVPDIGAAEFEGLDLEVTAIYVGPAGGTWSTAGNWGLGVTPACDTTALISDVVTVVEPGAVAANVTVDGPGAELIITGSLSTNWLLVRAGATLTLNDATAVLNAREIILEPGSTFDWSAGTIKLRFGRLESSDPVRIGLDDDAVLELCELATVSTPMLIVGVRGELRGSGTIDGDLDNRGLVAPSMGTTADPDLYAELADQSEFGRINVLGDYVQASTGRLHVDIKGLTREEDFDYLRVSQSARLDGTIEVEVEGGFEPQLQHSFDIVDAASRAGVFSDVIALVTASGLKFDAEYRPDGATLSMVIAQLSRTLHVDDDAGPGGDGLSWDSAFNDFDLALADANVGDKIHVGQGVYSSGSGTFEMRSGIEWHGGYAGVDAQDPNLREPRTFLSILRSPIEANDVDLSAILDGMVIEMTGVRSMVVADGAPHVVDCWFRDTGVIQFLDRDDPAGPAASIQFYGCTFQNMSTTSGRGGALWVRGQWEIDIQDCEFIDNVALTLPFNHGAGGGILAERVTSMSITDSMFIGNMAEQSSGAIHMGGGVLTITDTEFIGNSAIDVGGALSVRGISPTTLTGLHISGNTALEAPGLEVGSFLGLRPIINATGEIGDGVKNNGIIRPGVAGAGRVLINGDFTQDLIQKPDQVSLPRAGILELDLGGNTPETQYDVVNIVGDFFGRGTLNVEFINEFVPLAGDTFEVMTAASIVNTFDAALMPGFPDNRFLRLVYNTGPLGPGGALGGASVVLQIDTLSRLLGFDDPASTDVGGVASGSVVADIDGMNGPDVVVTIPDAVPTNAGIVVILFNAGTDLMGTWGGFASASTLQIQVGAVPTAVEAGFFNADADIDLAITNAGDNTVTILLSDGNGGFVASTVAVGLAPSDLVTGDFAGGADLAVSNADDDTITILANDGTGVFTIAETLDVDGDGIPNSSPRAITAADFDGDGLLDLAVANQNADTVSVLLATVPPPGGSARPFILPFIIIVDPRPIDITPIDIDNDKDLDLVTANFDAGSISLIENKNFGTFSSSSSLLIGDKPRSLTVGDFDADGDTDIAAVVDDGTGQSVVKVLRNDTGGSTTFIFANAEDLGQGENVVLVDSGDVDQNGQTDLITISGATLTPVPDGTKRSSGAGTGGAVVVRLNESRQPCPADITSAVGGTDGIVGIDDFLAVLAGWGPCGAICPADTDNDGSVGSLDFFAVITGWGPCP